MPLKRTPPKNTKRTYAGSPDATEEMEIDNIITPKTKIPSSSASCNRLQLPNIASQQKHDSEPDLHTLQNMQSHDVSNITLRRKQLEDRSTYNMGIIMEQMKNMFTSFSMEQASRLVELQSSISNIERQNTDISKCVEFLSSKYDDMLNQMKNLEVEKKKDQLRIRDLEDKVEALERKLKDPIIEIKNLPLVLSEGNKYETKNDLCEIVKRLGKLIKVDINENDIKDIYCKKTHKDTQKLIVYELTSVIQKEKIMEAVRVFNKGKQNKDKLNSEHLGLSSPKLPIYVSEALTQKTQRLLYDAKKISKDKGFVHCCTYRGSVYIRKVDKGKYIKINNEIDLSNIVNID